MPDHDRKPAFLHTLGKNLGEGKGEGECEGEARCPSCRGIGVTLQADCMCCGREIETDEFAKAEDITNSVKALKIKTEGDHDEPLQAASIPASVQDGQPAGSPMAAAGRRTSNDRQRRSLPSLRPGSGSRYASLDQVQQQRVSENPLVCSRNAEDRSPSSSTRRVSARGSASGSARRGNVGAHRVYRGVRTRRGVRGFLVEIRPPKWRRTIWLGTYNTSLEAAGAYDAGVFYTKKFSTKFNFDISEGSFPPLPPHLRIDDPASMDDVKVFVQRQARLAARRMKMSAAAVGEAQIRETNHDSSLMNQPSSSTSCLTGSVSPSSASAPTDLHSAGTTEVKVEVDSYEFDQLPYDSYFVEFGQGLHDETDVDSAIFMDQACQPGDMEWQMLPEEDKNED